MANEMKWSGNFVKLPLFTPEILESHLINCIDIGGTCNCTCTSCVYKGLCRCLKCRCNNVWTGHTCEEEVKDPLHPLRTDREHCKRCIDVVSTLSTELYEEEPSDYMIG